ncbi:aspartate aminotransferase family protein [Kushneria aurantia]|uniref:Aspartate aminotransferase family protein n=1 Tax=Kushneria aurantia TaxID=504092 RepID=A0ABV6GA28_9GAMM|nr:aspartate aminotransferase family protein [Kushneria aurantia]
MSPTQPRQILDMNAFNPSRDRAGENPLLERHHHNFGAASVLFYRDPIEMVSASGCWMEAADGTRYLDFYNNVPSVGHCHPRVVEAVSCQLARLNIHTRYLNQCIETYAERLKATLSRTLDNLVMTCTGSEANDLALRIAALKSGNRGVIVTENAYHGNTEAVTAISPSALKRAPLSPHVVTVPAPSVDAFGSDITTGFTTAVKQAIETLRKRGYGLAAFICDAIFSSDGIHADPTDLLKPSIAAVHAAGGIYIADEVQPGFGRTGDAYWGFERHTVTPDIVTMGKPMGNGFPLAGLAVNADALACFCEEYGYFNTFGGNPVACAAGQAVLEVMEEEQLQANAQHIGAHLGTRLEALRHYDRRITAVRGAGLFIGIDLCHSGETATPSPELTSAVINGLRERRVLIGAAGRFGNTLKIRPPLCLDEQEADFFVEALSDTLASLSVKSR